jgi:tRNA pseudouridine55 synthase
MAKTAVRQIAGGFLNVNKGAGLTSMDVLRRIKRITGQQKVGHAGTLDPDATGVLPVAIGKATKFIDHVMNGRKRYSMTVRLGSATDTYDASGEVTASSDVSSITQADVMEKLPDFSGELSQVPPMYSAIKRNGMPLYKLARQGVEVEREPRAVSVYELKMLDWSHPEFDLEIECGSGFYARSLAHDLGEALGAHAHLFSLVRTRVGEFLIDDAVTLEELQAAADRGEWAEHVRPIDAVLQHLSSISLNPLTEDQFRHGQPVRVTQREVDASRVMPGALVRIYDSDGSLIATATYDPSGPWWKPDKVIAPA